MSFYTLPAVLQNNIFTYFDDFTSIFRITNMVSKEHTSNSWVDFDYIKGLNHIVPQLQERCNVIENIFTIFDVMAENKNPLDSSFQIQLNRCIIMEKNRNDVRQYLNLYKKVILLLRSQVVLQHKTYVNVRTEDTFLHKQILKSNTRDNIHFVCKEKQSVSLKIPDMESTFGGSYTYVIPNLQAPQYTQFHTLLDGLLMKTYTKIQEQSIDYFDTTIKSTFESRNKSLLQMNTKVGTHKLESKHQGSRIWW